MTTIRTSDPRPGQQLDALVPTIDVSKPLDEAARTALDRACRDHGFFLIVGHGQQDLIRDTWDVAQRFFAQDTETKRTVMRDESLPLGYYDRELTKRRRDQKEVFDYGAIRDPDRNRWPATPADFKQRMVHFYVEFAQLAQQTLGLVFQAMGAARSLADEFHGDPRTSNVRLNYYPVADPLAASERATTTALGEMALHHHTDPGIITLLLQDDTGGLQCESLAHGWIDVPPRADAIVVNLGDVMQVWTNDRYRAASHRVVHMTTAGRLSAPFFLNPPGAADIAPIDALLQDEQPRFRPFSWRDFITGRVTDNFADLGEDDIQIDRFRINRAA